jgi:ketosteroid isomerase-like protein
MSTENRHEAARDVMRQLGIGEDWLAVADPDIPPDLLEILTDSLRAWGRTDLDWLIEWCDPEIVIRQVPEIPDSSTYTGPEAFVDALLDWPRQWEDFHIDPRRIFAADDEHLVVVALHRGRPPSMDIQVELEIVFLVRYRGPRLLAWDMFLTPEEALRRAAERRGHADDDRPAEGDGGERAQEARPEEARADHR